MAEVAKTTNTDDKKNAGDVELRWGLQISEVYPIALKFFKEKDGSKALILTYNDRLKMVALTKQVLHGKYAPSLLPDNGLFDVVGNNRRQAWQLLGDMSKEEAMYQFVSMMDHLCPLFTHVVEAHKVEKEEAERKRKEEEEELKRQLLAREDELRRQQDLMQRQLSQEALVRAALNQQTYNQFHMYAQLQYPNNPQQQDALIVQLQEQHFIQYMQQVYSQQQQQQQQQNPKQQQNLQQQQQQQQQHNGQIQPQQQQQFVANELSQQSQQQQVQQLQQQQVQQQQQQAQQLLLQQQQLNQQHQQQIASTTSTPTAAATMLNKYPANGIINNSLPTTATITTTTPTTLPLPSLPQTTAASTTATSTNNNILGSLGNSNSGININFDRKEDGAGVFNNVGNPPLMKIETASLWTRKDLKNFKESLSSEQDSMITIGSGELVTVRVPTHANGTSIFWEFATDGYDIGFGLSFEWSPSTASDDPNSSSAPSSTTKDEVSKKVDVVVPIVRRQSQAEVQCGSHVYPGTGVYLLMFDNSYSLWRSKNIFYRVYYSQ